MQRMDLEPVDTRIHDLAVALQGVTAIFARQPENEMAADRNP